MIYGDWGWEKDKDWLGFCTLILFELEAIRGEEEEEEKDDDEDDNDVANLWWLWFEIEIAQEHHHIHFEDGQS